MKKTRVCELLGIEYPIIQAPMAWVTCAELVAAVSNAGALGTLGPNASADNITRDVEETGERLREQIRKIRSLTDKPFAVNFPVGRGPGRAFSDRCIAVGIEERVPVAVISTGAPNVYTKPLKEAGIKVLHAIAQVHHARRAEEEGVDAVVCEGYEGGGHSGFEQIPTFVLTPQVVDATNIPVIAAGGIGDARGVVAAFALGAEGVYMGTRFLATRESRAFPELKQAILEANDMGTVSYGLKTGGSPMRTLKNEFSRKYLEMKFGGSSDEELNAFEREQDRLLLGLIGGDLEEGTPACGAVAGLITETMGAAEVVESIVSESSAVLARLQ